ncbi:hypothetical protein AB0C93_11940 [Streptomyces sp. NPDC048518]|uniref:hypothetical protein n=1 Tax=Streptomyces sp. NPDC048518 TaxID=3155029 RepID=UPI00340B5C46
MCDRRPPLTPWTSIALSPAAAWRARVSEARHLGVIRLERHRLCKDLVGESYGAMAEVLAGLT